MENIALLRRGLSPTLGYRLVESRFCVVTEDVTVKRTWRERLFTWPWRPWAKTKIVAVTKPDPALYLVGSTVFGHPETIDKLKEAIL